MTEYEILSRIQNIFQSILGNKLAGIYVHGSMAFQCFHWNKSDIDFIAVVREKLNFKEKEAIISELLRLDEECPPKGLEMSVVLEAVCNPFVYPTPYELHFSNDHKEWYQADLAGYCQILQGTDKDLAAHFTVIREVGIALCGRAIQDVFAPVPRENYLDSIMEDIKDAEEDITENPVYFILNLCRVLAYLEEGNVISKRQGGAWGIRNLPECYIPVIKGALDDYEGKFEEEEHRLKDFAEYILQQVNQRIKNELVSDFEYLYNALKSHPLLLQEEKRVRFEQRYEELRSKLQDYNSLINAMTDLTTFFEDGHTNIELPYTGQDYCLKTSCGWQGDRAVLRLNECIYNEHYKDTLSRLAVWCRERYINTLELDLSKNMGGSSAVIDEFIKYVNINSFRRYEMIDYSSGSPQYITKREEVIPNRKKDILFPENIICRVSNTTFSSARTFAVTLKDNGIAKIVGQSTGGKPCSYGMPRKDCTPNLGIRFRVSRCLFLRPDAELDAEIALFPDDKYESDFAEANRIICVTKPL